MKIFALPQELALRVLEIAELPPTEMLALGKQLTRAPNVISLAALDNSLWKRWASAQTLPASHPSSLSRAFGQRFAGKEPWFKQDLVRLYRHEDPVDPMLADDFDTLLAACRRGLDITGIASAAMLREPNIAIELLADARCLRWALPHTIFTLQDTCVRFELPVPEGSKSDELWQKFSPKDALRQRGHTSLYASAKTRWLAKADVIKEAIENATELARMIRSPHRFAEVGSDDFDYMQALCARRGSSIQNAAPQLLGEPQLALMAMSNLGGRFLSLLPAELRDDPVIVTAAVRHHSAALQVASERCRSNKAVVRAACDHSGGAIRFATDELRDDPIFIHELLQTWDRMHVFMALTPRMMRNPQLFVSVKPIFTNYCKDFLSACDDGRISHTQQLAYLTQKFVQEFTISVDLANMLVARTMQK